jgi:inhibitor of KinA sporulation pathway (predicted exonuclease)
MKQLLKRIKLAKYLIFVDFEGTQTSHEMIAYGACRYTINPDGTLKGEPKTIEGYVLAHNPIGEVVTDLTGITEDTLAKKGIPFAKAMARLYSLAYPEGITTDQVCFLTFGSHDCRIINQSAMYNPPLKGNSFDWFFQHYLDFQAFFSQLVRDANHNPLSLTHGIEYFHKKPKQGAHDALVDAENLATLYSCIFAEKRILLDGYIRFLQNETNRLPAPLALALRKLLKHENVTSEEFYDEVEKYLA